MSRFLAGLILAGAVLPAVAVDVRDPNIYDTANLVDPNGTTITWDDANSPDTAGQVNLSGATLFQSFFQVGASTIDAIDVDNDGDFGFLGVFSDQLATTWSCGSITTHWVVQYRAIGSGNGLGEFVDFQLLGTVPDSISSDDSLINRVVYGAGAGAVNIPGCPDEGQGTNTPFRQVSVDFGVMDVPTSWFVTQPTGIPNWDRKPAAPGYGLADPNTVETWPSALKELFRDDPNDPNQVITLITGGTVGADTVIDTPLAWVPIVPIQNHGVGYTEYTITDLQYHFLTGRRQNGENLAAGTRDSGSGTRNGFNNSIGIDPSWGRGDNLHTGWRDSASGYVGRDGKWTNTRSSSRLEDATENKRLVLAYTGLFDSSKAAVHFDEGAVEIPNVIFDNLGGTQPVRPSVQNIVENGDPNNSFTLGGPETFASRGTFQPGDAFFMANGAAAAYVRNIDGSIASFVANPGDPNDFGTPGQKLASNFILLGALDNVPLDDPNLGIDPVNFVPNTTQVPALKTETLNNTTFYPGSGQTLAPYGSRFDAGLGYTPRRNPAIYTDGEYTTEEYRDAWGGTTPDGAGLPSANKIQGDFDFDGVRTAADIAGLIACIPDPNIVLDPNDALSAAPFIAAQDAWALAQAGKTDAAGTAIGAANPVIPAIIGDLNSNGDLDAEDARYFADGLVVIGSCVDRAAGFKAVDDAFGGNFFGTTIASGAAYVNGDSMADIAGGTPTPGGLPAGHDGVINMTDVNYIKANFVDWSNDIDGAIVNDLSADMNGDCVVDGADVSTVYCIMGALGDVDCSGLIDAFDIEPYITALLNPAQYELDFPACDILRADTNNDGQVDAFDIEPFISIVLGGGCR